MPVTRDQAQMIATLATNCRPSFVRPLTTPGLEVDASPLELEPEAEEQLHERLEEMRRARAIASVSSQRCYVL